MKENEIEDGEKCVIEDEGENEIARLGRGLLYAAIRSIKVLISIILIIHIFFICYQLFFIKMAISCQNESIFVVNNNVHYKKFVTNVHFFARI